LSRKSMNPTSEIFGCSILAATLLGPIAAVLITRYIDQLRERSSRRLWIFRTLMATRRTLLSPEHIAALNQIELDFPERYRCNERVSDVYEASCYTVRTKGQRSCRTRAPIHAYQDAVRNGKSSEDPGRTTRYFRRRVCPSRLHRHRRGTGSNQKA